MQCLTYCSKFFKTHDAFYFWTFPLNVFRPRLSQGITETPESKTTDKMGGCRKRPPRPALMVSFRSTRYLKWTVRTDSHWDTGARNGEKKGLSEKTSSLLDLNECKETEQVCSGTNLAENSDKQEPRPRSCCCCSQQRKSKSSLGKKYIPTIGVFTSNTQCSAQ